MTDDNELERRQFMQKPTPAKPKVPSGNATSRPSPPPASPSPMFDKFVPLPPQSEHDALSDFAEIARLLGRHSRETRHRIMELLDQLMD